MSQKSYLSTIWKIAPVLLIAGLLVMAFGMQAEADYPDDEIELVVPWSAGGITDTTARAFAPHFEKHLDTSLVIENRPGASGAVGTEYTYDQDADGSSVLLSAETPGTFQVMGLSDLGFEDFEHIMMLVSAERGLVVPADSPYETAEELIEDIRENPGQISMSYSGPGASGHILGLLLEEAGLEISKTPAGGGHEAMIETISGRVDFTLPNLSTVMDYVEEGDLRLLAVLDDEPSDRVDAPPLTEALPELEEYLPLHFPNCLMVKEGTSQEKIDVLKEAAVQAGEEEDWIEYTEDNYFQRLHHLTGDEVLEYWQDWQSVVAWLLYEAGETERSPEEFDIPRGI